MDLGNWALSIEHLALSIERCQAFDQSICHFDLSFECYFQAMHADMKKEWEQVKICNPDHPDFPQKLLDFTTRYNGRHM